MRNLSCLNLPAKKLQHRKNKRKRIATQHNDLHHKHTWHP